MGQNESKLQKKKEKKERLAAIEETRAILRRTLYQVHHQGRFTIAPTQFDELATRSFQQEKAKMKVNSLLAAAKPEAKKRILEISTIDANYVIFKNQPKPRPKNGRKLKRLQVDPPKATKVVRKSGTKDEKGRMKLEIVLRDSPPETEVQVHSQTSESVPDSDDIMCLHMEIKSLATEIFESHVDKEEEIPETKTINGTTLKTGQRQVQDSKKILKMEPQVAHLHMQLMKACREMMTRAKPIEVNEGHEMRVKLTKPKNGKGNTKSHNLENQELFVASLEKNQQPEQEKKPKKNSCWKCFVPNWLLRRFETTQEAPKLKNSLKSPFKAIFKKKNKVAPEMIPCENEGRCGGIISTTNF